MVSWPPITTSAKTVRYAFTHPEGCSGGKNALCPLQLHGQERWTDEQAKILLADLLTEVNFAFLLQLEIYH